MSIMFFSTVSDDSSQRVQGIIGAVIDPEPLVVYRSVEALAGRLRRPLSDLDIAVVKLSTREELLDLLSLGDRLADLPTILILPDGEEDTLGKAHLIRPRFLAYADSTPNIIAAVLEKILRKHSKGPPLKTHGNAHEKTRTIGRAIKSKEVIHMRPFGNPCPGMQNEEATDNVCEIVGTIGRGIHAQAGKILESHPLELLNEPPTFIAPAVWGLTINGELTPLQQRIRERVPPIIEEVQ